MLVILSKKLNKIITSTILLMIMVSCGEQKKETTSDDIPENKIELLTAVPNFNSDSAFHFIEQQVSFGPRVPNTLAHKKCAEYLTVTLRRFCDTVYIQETNVTAFDGTNLTIQNIIGVFNPENRNRILLAAHWDTRPFADADPNPDNFYTPIDGANDGGSGVGVLLEIARKLSLKQIETGIDIIFFDAEDYGAHSRHHYTSQDTWALGSQYWGKNPHVPNYYARFGILLDMVGASGATFKHEGYSKYYAPSILRRVWQTARNVGFGEYFINQRGGYVTDDHYYINEYRNIPTINIIHQDSSTPHGFFKYWHTVDDTLDKIDKNTLKAVGQTLLHILYED